MARSGIVWDDKALINSLRTMNARSQGYLSKITKQRAGLAQEFMRENAPWHDDSGDAREGLVATTDIAHPSYVILLAHTVAYGWILETRRSGETEIIRPTVDVEGDNLMRDASALWDHLFKGRGATS